MKLEDIIRSAMEEDLGDGDHTSLATIPAGARGKAKLTAKESGVIAGMEIARMVFLETDRDIQFHTSLQDGDRIETGDTVFIVEGSSRSLLAAERLALNFLQRMSGIATYTRSLVDKVNDTGVKVLDTRKTTPLLRELEKLAVRAGGGSNHRMGLYDMIMIKDNHVDFAGGIRQAIRAARQYLRVKGKQLPIEIEVRDFDELTEVLNHGGVDRIMLDNFSPEDLKKAVEMINGRYETEASGGITFGNIREYALTGVDFISVGALTHHIKSLDLSMKAIS